MFKLPVLAASVLAACALAAPVAAVADVVTVTTHSTGLVDPNPIVLSTLGLSDPGAGPIAFDLTLSATFDPSTPGFIDSSNNVYAASSNYSVSFQVGSQLYQYSGNSWSDVQVVNVGTEGQGYQQQVGFNPPTSTSNSITFTQWVAGPAAVIGLA